VQEIHKQTSPAAFVTVRQRVVFDNEIQQMSGFAFNRGIGRISEDGLFQIA
jgi:hypothetical protein